MSFARAFSLAALLVAFLFLSGTASSEIFAKLEPSNGSTSIYESEIVQLNLVVINTSNADANNIFLSAHSDSGISLVLSDGRLAKIIDFSVLGLKPGQIESRQVLLIGVKPSQTGQKVYLDYSDYNVSYSSSLSMLVRNSPVSLNARLAASPIGPGEKSKAIVTIKNSSNSEISNVLAALFVPSGILVGNGISFPSIGPGETLSDLELGFEASKDSQGNYPLIVQAGFTDAAGNHVLQKQLSLTVGFGFSIILAILIILFLFVLGAFIFSGKRRRKENLPQAKKEAPSEAESESEEDFEEEEDVFEETPPAPKPKQKPKAKEKAKPKGKKK